MTAAAVFIHSGECCAAVAVACCQVAQAVLHAAHLKLFHPCNVHTLVVFTELQVAAGWVEQILCGEGNMWWFKGVTIQ